LGAAFASELLRVLTNVVTTAGPGRGRPGKDCGMPKYLYLNGPSESHRWTLPEATDVGEVEAMLADGIAHASHVTDLGVDVELDQVTARLHVLPAAITAFAVVDKPQQSGRTASTAKKRLDRPRG
jgi:hypothetical protein